MKQNKRNQIIVFSALLGVTSTFAASSDALLDLLVEKGVFSEAEAAAVADELKEEKERTTFSSKGDATVKLRFNGRLHYQYDSLDMEADGAAQASTNHFYFRRLRLGAKATHENGLFAETVLDFAENELSIDKAVAGYTFDPALHFRVGYQKVPFGIQETTSSSKIKTIERSPVNRFFADDIDFAGRHSGLHASGNLGGGFSYSAALVNAAQGEGSRLLGESNADNDLAVFGRLQWAGRGLTLGLDGGSQSNNTKVYSGKDASADELGENDVTALTGYANYQFSGFDILGEYFTGDLDDAGDVDGYALRIAYQINEKFEPVFRYAHLNSDGFEIDSDELIRRAPDGGTVGGLGAGETFAADGAEGSDLNSYYFGINYDHNKSVSFMLGYELAEIEDDSDSAEVEIDGARARLQVLW